MKIFVRILQQLFPASFLWLFSKLFSNTLLFKNVYKKPLYYFCKFTYLRRIINNALIELSMHFQTKRTINKPNQAIFEASNLCNLNCILCNTGGLKSHFTGVPKGVMDFNTFRIGIDKLLPELEYILLYTWGEPLLNKDLFKCIKYAYENSVITQLSTNMMFYNENIGRKFIESGLTKLIVSCDGFTQETYEKYRKGGDLSKIISGVENLVKLKENRMVRYPLIEMQFIVFKYNEGEMKIFEEFWKSKGTDSVKFIRMSFMSKIGMKIAKQNDIIPENPLFTPYHPYGKIKFCPDMYNQVTIDWNGDWYTCCFPPGEIHFKIANITSDKLRKVWNGERYRYYREIVKKRNIDKNCYFETMCHDCIGIYPRSNSISYWK